MPLSNISSALAETASGKNTRHSHFQDEAQGGGADTGNRAPPGARPIRVRL